MIELRQSCLGGYESGEENLPDASALAAFPEKFAGVRFNVAVNIPFLSPETSPDHPVFQAGKSSAEAVAGDLPPHLRLVDLTTSNERLEGIGPQVAGNTIARLTRSVAKIGGVLSVEHAYQPWRQFRKAFDAARKQLGTDRDRLRLCYDPCNLRLLEDGTDPNQVTLSLSAGELSMVHFKQRQSGRILPRVSDGEIDWVTQLSTLKQIGYAGPGLFEVDSHERVWEFLEESVNYLRRAGLGPE